MMNQPMPMQPTSNCDEKFPTAKALCLLIQNYYFQQQQNFVMNGMAGMELQQSLDESSTFLLGQPHYLCNILLAYMATKNNG